MQSFFVTVQNANLTKISGLDVHKYVSSISFRVYLTLENTSSSGIRSGLYGGKKQFCPNSTYYFLHPLDMVHTGIIDIKYYVPGYETNTIFGALICQRLIAQELKILWLLLW